MRNPTERGLVPSFTKLLLPLSIGLAVSAGAYAQPENPASYLEEVTVTASKRVESLQEVAMSISAITGDNLDRQGIADLENITSTVPSMSMRSSGPGRTKLNIRGISAATGIAPTVSFYIDEMPVSTISSGSSTSFAQTIVSPKLYDLERVEVLRGPQGTLYGSSSMGGTVRLITRQPVIGDFEGKVSADVSSTKDGGINSMLNGVVNLPVGANTAVRMVGSMTDKDGYIDRVNRTTGAKYDDKVNNEETYSLRAALRHEFDDGNAYIQPYVFTQKTEMDGKPNYDGPSSAMVQARDFDAPEPYEDEFTMANLTYGHEFESVSALISISNIDREFSNVEDITDPIHMAFAPDNPVSQGVMADEQVTLDDTTFEARLSSNTADKFQWVGGVYRKDSEAESGYRMQRGFGYTTTDDDMVTSNPVNGVANTQDLKTYKENAVFGELSYDFTDQFSVTVGLRALKYKFTQYKEDWGFVYGDTTRSQASTLDLSVKDEDVSSKITASFQATDETQFYATISDGSRPGGGNRTIPRTGSATAVACDADLTALGIQGSPSSYSGDSVENLEFGIKSDMGNIRINGAFYQMKWKDIQQAVTTSSECGFNFIANLGEAESRGVEIDVTAGITENFFITAGLGYTDAKFKKSVPGVVTAGDKLADVPEYTFNLNADYSIPVSSGEYFIMANYSFVDDTLELPGQASDNVLPNGITSGNVKPSYSIVNLRMGFTSNESWEGTLYVNNVTDKEAFYSYTDALAFLIPDYDRTVRNTPRTIGAAITYNF